MLIVMVEESFVWMNSTSPHLSLTQIFHVIGAKDFH